MFIYTYRFHLDKLCTVNPLDKAAIGTPFGYENFNGEGHIFSPSNALDLEYNVCKKKRLYFLKLLCL